jgi:hypothetical protein
MSATRTGLLLPRTRDELRDRLQDAAAALRLVAAPRHSHPSERVVASYPEVLREYAEAYGYHSTEVRRTRATAAQVSRMGEVLDWIALHWPVAVLTREGLPGDGGKVAWLRAAGWRWPQIAEWRRMHSAPPSGRRSGGPSGLAGGNTVRSLYTIEARCLDHLLGRLGVTLPEQDPAASPDAVTGSAPASYGVVVTLQEEDRVAMVRSGSTWVPRVLVRHARAQFQRLEERKS